MRSEYVPIDRSDAPSLAELVEEVRRTNTPRILRRADEDVAVISPVRKTPRRSPGTRRSPADIDAFLSSAGGWAGVVDTDKLQADIEDSRRLPIKPRPEV